MENKISNNTTMLSIFIKKIYILLNIKIKLSIKRKNGQILSHSEASKPCTSA